MPTLMIWHGYKFRFYALDQDEPPHVHIVKDGKSLKIWLQNLDVANNKGYISRKWPGLPGLSRKKRDEWIGAWNDFFGL